MSNEDISMVYQVLLGISNADKNTRSNSVNKLQELSKNLGALTYCLIEIASKQATNDKEKIIKTTALVICRKILDLNYIGNWKKIDNDLKEKIKIKILNLLNSEPDPSQNSKICDLIISIMDKVLDSNEEWPELLSLAFSIYNYDPTDNSKLIQIRTLLKLLKGGIYYLYKNISDQYNKLIPYLEKLLDSEIDMKIKTVAVDLICELISYCDNKEIKYFKESIKKIFNNIYKGYLMKENMPEDCVKSMLVNCIGTEAIESELFSSIFSQIFTLSQNLISKKDYKDDKIRELAFELIINFIEEKAELFLPNKKYYLLLSPFLEMIFNYALEFDRTYDQSWAIPTGNKYTNNIEDSVDEKINFSLSAINRIIECMGIEGCENELKNILEKNLQKSWECQYFALFVLASYSESDEEIAKVENLFQLIFNCTSSPEAYLRFSAVHCIHTFSINYNPSFQTQTIKELIPLLENLLKKETVLRIQCEIVATIISFIQYTTSDALAPYVKDLFELLFTIFKKNDIPIIIRKLVLDAILGIITTMEQDISPLAPISFDIIINYFVESYKNKANQILYGVLLECITSLGIYVKEKYNQVIPDIVNCLIEIVKGFNSNNIEIIRGDLINSLERLLPILQEKFQNLLPNLIETIITLIKFRPQMSISSSPNEQFDVDKLLFEEDKEEDKMKEKEIKTSDTEDLVSSLTLLNTIIKSVGNNFLKYVEQVETEIEILINYKADGDVRIKSSKILPNLLLSITNPDIKAEKGKKYIYLILYAIEKEINNNVCKKFFVYLRKVIDNCGQILNKSELNKLFDIITGFFNNLKIKRNKLISNSRKMKTNNADNKGNENEKENKINVYIKEIEDIQNEISDIIGILLKTHKQIADEIIIKILKNIIPTYTNSQNLFEIKMGLFISDDLIEFIGQDILGDENWSLMYNIITKLVLSKDVAIRQGAAYGIGNFAKFTTKNFDNYSKGLIDSLYKAMDIQKDIDDEVEDQDEEYNDFGMSYDNMVAAIGKIINYQFNSQIVQSGLNELINKWIMNLPIKYDDVEQEEQHEWLVDLFLVKRNLIGENCYNHYFETLIKMHETKTSNKKIDEKIKKIFNEFVKKEDNLKQIVENIYHNSDEILKRKLEKLIK